MELAKMSDLELAKVQGNLYQQLMQTQGNLIAVNHEIDKRTPKTEPKHEEKNQPLES